MKSSVCIEHDGAIVTIVVEVTGKNAKRVHREICHGAMTQIMPERPSEYSNPRVPREILELLARPNAKADE